MTKIRLLHPISFLARSITLLRNPSTILLLASMLVATPRANAIGAGWNQFQLAPINSASDVSHDAIKSVSRDANTMEVFWIGADGSIEDASFYEGQGWNRFQLAPPGSASRTGGIAAVSRAPHTMEVWWIGQDGSVQDAYWYAPGPWHQYELAGPGSASYYGGITAVSRAPNTMELWWVTPDGGVQDA